VDAHRSRPERHEHAVDGGGDTRNVLVVDEEPEFRTRRAECAATTTRRFLDCTHVAAADLDLVVTNETGDGSRVGVAARERDRRDERGDAPHRERLAEPFLHHDSTVVGSDRLEAGEMQAARARQ
jgi:hypothetical protein